MYRSYTPNKAGRILKIVKPAGPGDYGRGLVLVGWENGTESEIDTRSLNALDALIEDTQRKLTTHMARRARIAERWPER